MSDIPLTGTCVVAPEALGPFRNGGVGTAAYRLAQLLASAGYEVTLLYTGQIMEQDRGEWQRRYYDERGVHIVVLEELAPPSVEDGMVEPSMSRGVDEMRSLRVYEFLRRQRFQVIYFQEFMGHGLRAMQAWRAGLAFTAVRMVTWCHSSMLWSFLGNDLQVGHRSHLEIEAHERLATRLSDVVASPSGYMSKWVAEHWQIDDVRPLPYWYQATPDGDAGGGRPVKRRFEGLSHLVFFGRLERRKGLDWLLAALRASDTLRGRLRKVSFLGRQINIEGRLSGEHIASALEGLRLEWEIVDHLGTDDALSWIDGQPEVLVVAPSVLDNFPFVIMELFQRQVPFISTRVGGIPEVVGAANTAALLAEPSAHGVRMKLEEVLERQSLTIDYTAGYCAAAAARQALEFHRACLDTVMPSAEVSSSDRPVDVLLLVNGEQCVIESTLDDLFFHFGSSLAYVGVLVGDGSSDVHLREIAQCLARGQEAGRWHASGVWTGGSLPDRFADEEADVLVLRVGERLTANGAVDLRRGLDAGGYDCVCGYVRRPFPGGGACFEQRPLGAALELGFLEEEAITTPLLVHARARGVLAGHLRAYYGQTRLLLQGFACELEVRRRCHGGERIGVVPVRVAEGLALEGVLQSDRARLSRLYQHYQAVLNGELLFPFVFPGYSPLPGGASPAIEAYSVLAMAPEDALLRYLDRQRGEESVVRIIAAIAPWLERWRRQAPQLYIYGAGDHSKVVLGLFPELWKWVVAFIDAGRRADFLGRPCLTPDSLALPSGASVLYSSRAHEVTMYARLAAQPVEHVLIYAEGGP